MKTRHGIVAVALIGSLAFTGPALAAGKGQAVKTQTKSTVQTQQRLRDGSCIQSKTKSQTGNTYRGENQGSTTQTRSGSGK